MCDLSVLFSSVFSIGVTNYSPGPSGQTIANDIELHIADEVLRIAQNSSLHINLANHYASINKVVSLILLLGMSAYHCHLLPFLKV